MRTTRLEGEGEGEGEVLTMECSRSPGLHRAQTYDTLQTDDDQRRRIMHHVQKESDH